jgi:hypothetical protein
LCVVVLGLAPSLRAQAMGASTGTVAADGAVDPAKEAKVKELFEVMHLDRMMDQMMTAVKSMVNQMTDSAPGMDKVTPAQKRIIAEFQEKAMKLAIDSMGWKVMEPEYVKLYANTFSMQELDAALAFYKSPEGQSFMAKTPQLTTAGMKIVQERMGDLQPKLKDLQDEFMKKMEAASEPAGKAAAPKH